MEYRPPKPVSNWGDLVDILALANYQQSWPAGWNHIAWTEVRNRPPPEPERNSRGRLTWTHPVAIHHHAISPDPEDNRHSRVARLARKGWVGETVGNFSDYEIERILEYVRGLGDRAYQQRPWTDEASDERPGDIGPFESRHRSFYFAGETERAGLVALIQGFPQRTIELYVPDNYRQNPHFSPAVAGLNWHVFRGADGNLLTLPADIGNTALVALKMFVACPAPAL